MRWRALGALAAALAGILALECSDPEPAPDIAAPPAAAPAGVAAPPETALPAGLAARLLDRPLFSPDRRAAPPAETAADEPSGTDLPRLAGVIVGPGRRSAIFADAAGKPRIAGEGASIGRFTVRAIAPGKVTMTSPDGESVLRPWYADAKAPDIVRSPGPGNGRAR